MLRQEDDLPDVLGVVRDLAVDGLQDGVWFATDRYGRMTSSGLSRSIAAKTQVQPSSHHFITSTRVVFAFSSNSWSRKRSGFSPSVVRKSVKRERMFPARCLTRMRYRVGFGIEGYEEIFVAQLRHRAFAEALVAAHLAAGFVEVVRQVGHKRASDHPQEFSAERSVANAQPPPPGDSILTRSPWRRLVLNLPGMDSIEPSRRDDLGLPWRSVCAAGQSPRTALAAVGEQRDFAVGEHFDLADDAVAAAMLSCSSAVGSQRIRRTRSGIGVLPAPPRECSASSSCDVCTPETPACRDGRPSRRQSFRSRRRVHRCVESMPPMVRLFMVPDEAAGMRSGIACASARSSTSTMRCEVSTLPPATAAGRTRVDDGSFGRDELNRTHESGGRRNILAQQAAEDVEAGGVGDGFDGVDAAFDLRSLPVKSTVTGGTRFSADRRLCVAES